MILLKPVWIRHEDDKPIFSVDIHPKGGRFATGGQGGQGGRIVIWNVAPVLSEVDEADPKVPKQLCQMDNHLACVNVVRWSCQGHLLASGGDDKLVMIWKLTGEGASTVFGGGGKVNVETWKCVHTLISHNGDVLDLAWAPHDGWLASASVDNTVIIWNTHKFPDKVAVLKGHTAMVKGVTWDPVGKYIASQSDDKSLRVWRTADWQQQEVVTDAFTDCSATTHVLRLSWSPDGQYLVSAHAMNGGGPTAQIIERDGWKQDKDFVGHRKAVTCVRFNSNILKKLSPGSPKTQQYCCCAVGSRDRSVSVWLTSLKRPLVVIKDLFDDSVLDISWSANGLHLLACSWDGTVACIIFNSDEIGIPLSEYEKDSLYERMYGKALQRNLLNTSFVGSQIIENPEMLTALDEFNDKNKAVVAMTPSEVELPKVSNMPTTPTEVAATPVLESPTKSMLVAANKQIETRLPSGKRRITPMLLKVVPTTPTKDVTVVPTVQPSQPSAFSTSSPSKSKIVVVQEDVRISAAKLVAAVQAPRPPYALPGAQINQLTCSEIEEQPIVRLIDVLEPLKPSAAQTSTKRSAQHAKLQVTNACVTTVKGKLSKIEVYADAEDKQPLWDTYLGSNIRCVQNNRRLVVACCDDLSINIFYIASGARALPPLLIEDVASALALSETGVCLVLTKTGLVHMWNIESGRSLLNRLSIRSLLSKKATVTGCSLTSTDLPLLTLSDGRAYTYNIDLQTWMLLSNPNDPLSRAGGSMAKPQNVSNLPLASLQKQIRYGGGNDSLPASVTLSFIESQISCALTLESPGEFRHWLLACVDHLLDKGPECRLRTILNDLMEPSHISSKRKRTETILGLSKKNLLSEILQLVKSRLPWQRLYKEFNEQLQLL